MRLEQSVTRDHNESQRPAPVPSLNGPKSVRRTQPRRLVSLLVDGDHWLPVSDWGGWSWSQFAGGLGTANNRLRTATTARRGVHRFAAGSHHRSHWRSHCVNGLHGHRQAAAERHRVKNAEPPHPVLRDQIRPVARIGTRVGGPVRCAGHRRRVRLADQCFGTRYRSRSNWRLVVPAGVTPCRSVELSSRMRFGESGSASANIIIDSMIPDGPL